MKKIYVTYIFVLVTGLNLFSQTMEVEVTPMIDNTIFKDTDVSNGLGEYIFTGTTNKDVKKRALVKFDLLEAGLEGVIADSVLLTLFPSKAKPGSTEVAVHRLTTEWGEGTSKANDGDGKGAPATTNDATWSYAKFNSDPWIKKGGDFDIEPSISNIVTEGTDALFRSMWLTLDVNFWLQEPTKNFGWIFIGDESNTETSVKFVSKDHSDNNMWPKLKIYYQTATSAPQIPDAALNLRVYQGAGLNNITISNPGDPGVCSMEVFSITGTRLFSSRFQLSRGNNAIETGIQDPGIYVYRIIQNQKTASGKLVISY